MHTIDNDLFESTFVKSVLQATNDMNRSCIIPSNSQGITKFSGILSYIKPEPFSIESKSIPLYANGKKRIWRETYLNTDKIKTSQELLDNLALSLGICLTKIINLYPEHYIGLPKVIFTVFYYINNISRTGVRVENYFYGNYKNTIIRKET